MSRQGKVNPAAIAALPIAIVLALSALLPYFDDGDAFSEYSFTISGWSFFSSVDQLMVLGILLAAVLLVGALVPEIREGRVEVGLGGDGGRSVEFPLIVVPAAAVFVLAATILFLLGLRILSPPAGLSQGAGLFIGAFLTVALAASAVGAIVLEVAPPGSAGGFGSPTPAVAPPPVAAGQATPAPPQAQVPPSPAPQAPAPGGEPPPPAPGTRRG